MCGRLEVEIFTSLFSTKHVFTFLFHQEFTVLINTLCINAVTFSYQQYIGMIQQNLYIDNIFLFGILQISIVFNISYFI